MGWSGGGCLMCILVSFSCSARSFFLSKCTILLQNTSVATEFSHDNLFPWTSILTCKVSCTLIVNCSISSTQCRRDQLSSISEVRCVTYHESTISSCSRPRGVRILSFLHLPKSFLYTIRVQTYPVPVILPCNLNSR